MLNLYRDLIAERQRLLRTNLCKYIVGQMYLKVNSSINDNHRRLTSAKDSSIQSFCIQKSTSGVESLWRDLIGELYFDVDCRYFVTQTQLWGWLLYKIRSRRLPTLWCILYVIFWYLVTLLVSIEKRKSGRIKRKNSPIVWLSQRKNIYRREFKVKEPMLMMKRKPRSRKSIL